MSKAEPQTTKTSKIRFEVLAEITYETRKQLMFACDCIKNELSSTEDLTKLGDNLIWKTVRVKRLP